MDSQNDDQNMPQDNNQAPNPIQAEPPQYPVAQESTQQISTPQSSKNNKKRVFFAIISLILVVLIGAGLYIAMNGDDESPVADSSTQIAAEETSDIYSQVQQIISETDEENSILAPVPATTEEEKQNFGIVYIHVKDESTGYVIQHTKEDANFSLINQEEISDDPRLQTQRQNEMFQISAGIESKLIERAGVALMHGTSFEQKQLDPNENVGTPREAFNLLQNDEYICKIEVSYLLISVGCIPKGEMEATVDFNASLIDAYIEKVKSRGETVVAVDGNSALIIQATPSDVENAPIDGYEVLSAGIGNATAEEEGIYLLGGGGGGKFYRPVDGQWVFFYGGQDAPICEGLDANEIEIQIYGDNPCYTNVGTTNQDTTTIQEYYQ